MDGITPYRNDKQMGLFRRAVCILTMAVISLSLIKAAAYAMPADKLVKLSNSESCNKAQAHWDKNELDSSLICFNIVANRADQKQSREDMLYVVAASTAMANIYNSNFYDFERATHWLLISEQIATKHGLTPMLANIYLVMASLENSKECIKLDQESSQQILNLLRKAFNIAFQENDQYVLVLAICNMISTTIGEHNLQTIEKELKLFQSVEIYDTIPARNFAKHTCIAAIALNNQQYNIALKELAELDGSDVSEHIRPQYHLFAHELLFDVYRDMKNDALAYFELDTMEQIARDNGLTIGIIETLRQKRDYYAERGNIALANDYELQFHRARDLFMAEAKVAKADEEKVLFRLNEANNEIKELSYKQRIQQTELMAMAVVALLLLTLLVLAWVSHRQTKEKNRSLYEQNQQLLANIDRMRQLRQEQERREKEQQALEPNLQPTSLPAEKYGRGKMGDDDITQVMDKVERVMDTATEIFAIDFSLDQLAELTGESRSRLSQAINQVPGRSFYSLLNEYRVREACRRMNDKKQYGGLTIEAIGQSVGFKSRSNFVATFKRITGLTPSTYLKQPPAPDSPTTETHADSLGSRRSF
ncbi:MAG: AraC family transcriptional regulator [Muribaculaceae bacterium]|nr:AraC family transcriptional regulator [Muribaculaceae bacterium]